MIWKVGGYYTPFSMQFYSPSFSAFSCALRIWILQIPSLRFLCPLASEPIGFSQWKALADQRVRRETVWDIYSFGSPLPHNGSGITALLYNSRFYWGSLFPGPHILSAFWENTTHFLLLSWSKDNNGFLLVVVPHCLRIFWFPWSHPPLSKLSRH